MGEHRRTVRVLQVLIHAVATLTQDADYFTTGNSGVIGEVKRLGRTT